MKKLILISMLVFSMALAGVAHAQELTVSAAMSLRDAFKEIGTQFESAHPGVTVTFNFSSSGKLRQQIEGGAPVDVYASASQAHMDALEKEGLIVSDSRKDFAGNALVLARPKGSALVSDFKSLENENVKRIAIGNPETSPAGKYAREVLTYLGLWDKVQPKLIYVETVRQVLDYLVRGEVDAGIFYASDAMLRKDDIEVVAIAPAGSHKPILYPIAAVKGSDKLDVARQFIEFLRSPKGKAVLKSKGFTVPTDE
jgi:molybdate transport system substrate-binding protein